MTPTQADTLRQLLEQQDIAALGTLHRGEPFVSMGPFALLPEGRGLVMHASRLATHLLIMVVPRALRVVGGFAQAWSASAAADYVAAMSGGEA